VHEINKGMTIIFVGCNFFNPKDVTSSRNNSSKDTLCSLDYLSSDGTTKSCLMPVIDD
jgi:hypothetical protein